MDKRETIRRYRQLHAELNGIVVRWDPYGLAGAGEIDDEFSDEVSRLLAALRTVDSEEAAIDAVQAVFARAFSGHDFPRPACEAVGREVFAWWQAAE